MTCTYNQLVVSLLHNHKEVIMATKKLICETCGKEYEKDTRMLHKVNRFCSSACYHASQVGAIRLSMRKRHIKICVVCGKEFETGGRAGDRGQTRCSMECQQAGRYRHGARANTITDPATLGYLAGFIDGEGSIFLAGRTI